MVIIKKVYNVRKHLLLFMLILWKFAKDMQIFCIVKYVSGTIQAVKPAKLSGWANHCHWKAALPFIADTSHVSFCLFLSSLVSSLGWLAGVVLLQCGGEVISGMSSAEAFSSEVKKALDLAPFGLWRTRERVCVVEENQSLSLLLLKKPANKPLFKSP